MKKLYTTLTMRDLNLSRLSYLSSLFKVASFGTVEVLFLSNASPVFQQISI
ncbi:hypothetical protein [Candidatus Bartonella washoeensis]|uniref:Uncharacterized protein n=1 Tax=Cardidatus Bartonella washoeensis 085-0475 TaxID=1094564 RepID=J0ZAZ6_9HYPH|nr:hypothetical protein [Bartonella washoeensis]EJF85018.1 hypothetical protein MCW_00904 [Bartonella washoeensis 085-0475]